MRHAAALVCLLATGAAVHAGPRPDWAAVAADALDPVAQAALERISDCVGVAYDDRSNPLDCVGVLSRDCPGAWEGAFGAADCEEAAYRAWMYAGWRALDTMTEGRRPEVAARATAAFDLWEAWVPLHCADALAAALPYEDGPVVQERRCRIEQAALHTLALTFTYLP